MVDLADHPDGARTTVRRERPHPGTQLSLFDLDKDMRHQVFLTDAPVGEGSLQHLRGPPPRTRPRRGPHPLRQDHRLRPLPLPPLRAQRRLAGAVPDRRRFDRPAPGTSPAWRVGHRRADEAPPPAAARGRPYHRGGRRLHLWTAATWPCRHELENAFARLTALPRPATSSGTVPDHPRPEEPWSTLNDSSRSHMSGSPPRATRRTRAPPGSG